MYSAHELRHRNKSWENSHLKEKKDVEKEPARWKSASLCKKRGIIFVPHKNRTDLSIQDSNGHFYAVASKYVSGYQKATRNALFFTKDGLDAIKENYNKIECPKLLYDITNFNLESKDIKNLKKDPASSPYFKDEKFLIKPNIGYDPMEQVISKPKAQKMRDEGLALCAWFIPSALKNSSEKSSKLFEELSKEKINAKKVRELIVSPDGKCNGDQKAASIGDLRKNGEPYLASILDLEQHHVKLLENLKKKTLQHLEKRYGVNENDRVALYFHFPYGAPYLLLHLHARVNQAMHPVERCLSHTLNDIINGLSKGKDIKSIILEKQEKDGKGHRDWPASSFDFFKKSGLEVEENIPNSNALESNRSNRIYLPSRDDISMLTQKRQSPSASLKRSYSLGAKGDLCLKPEIKSSFSR